jgi:hypothetical protein
LKTKKYWQFWRHSSLVIFKKKLFYILYFLFYLFFSWCVWFSVFSFFFDLFFFKQEIIGVLYGENGKVSPENFWKFENFEFLYPELVNYILI